MNKVSLFKAGVFGWVFGTAATAVSAEELARPVNLLFIMTDQQRFDALSCASNPVVKTPNLDRLAREGVRFENAFSYCPICVPARTVILTGHSIHSTGIVNNTDLDREAAPNLPTFDQILLRSGYRGEYHGKWHVPYQWALEYTRPVRWLNRKQRPAEAPPADESESAAFAQYVASHVPARSPEPGEKMLKNYPRPYRPDPLDLALSNGTDRAKQSSAYGCLDIPPEYTVTAFTAKEGLEGLERLKDGPFTLTISIGPPHPPMVLPRPYYGMYPAQTIPIPASLNDPRSNSPFPDRKGGKTNPYRNPEYIQQMASDYYGLVTEADEWIGRILARLDELKLTDHTLVVFTSDHGEMLGEHGMSDKGVLYEGAAHIPLILRLPGVIPAGTVVQSPVSHIDLFASILDYLHIPAVESQGRSLRPLIEGKEDNMDYCVSEWRSERRPTLMVRTKEWKYICGLNSKLNSVDALYNLRDDPDELNNLIGKNPEASRYIDQVQAMRTRLVSWLEHLHDPRAEIVRAKKGV